MNFINKILFSLIFISFSFSTYVYWEPEVPVPGGTVDIYYDTVEGALADNTAPVYIHLGYDGWLEVEDYGMEFVPALEGGNWWKFNYQIPENAQTIDFVFTDLNDNWDNNGGYGVDWHINMDYHWFPFNPGPNNTVMITLENVEQVPQIGWLLGTEDQLVYPIEAYQPDNSIEFEGYLLSPMLNTENGTYQIELGPFQNGEQIPKTIKFKILWEDGTWDAGSNGQIMFYDIYFNYDIQDNEPDIYFISPLENQNVQSPVEFNCDGEASEIEFWINGVFIGSDSNSPFEVIWDAPENAYGDFEVAAKAINEDGMVSFTFLDFFLMFSVINEPVPDWITDGLAQNGNQIGIGLYAPAKEYIAIKGNWNSDFTNGEVMKLSGDTLWWYETALMDGEYNYQFNIEGNKWIADPWSKDVDWTDLTGENESANFQEAKTVFKIGEDPFEWTDENYMTPEIKDVIIYETHLGDFSGDINDIGTYQHLIEKIESGYFTELGINAIELMPVNEFEGGWSWGYNPSFNMAPESSYGSANEFKELINTAHEYGIAILLDVVYNHLWGSSPLFQLYQPTGNYNFEDHDYDLCPYFQNQESEWGYKIQHWHQIDGRKYRGWKYILDALIHWVEEYHIDGFRFDVAWGIGWDGDDNGMGFYAHQLKLQKPDIILIAEEDNAWQINNSQIDAGWDFSFHHGLFNAVLGYEQNMDNLANLLNPISQGYNQLTGPLTYIESHDEPRIFYDAVDYLGLSDMQAKKLSALGAVILFTSPGVPMIYHGQEFGQGTPRETNPQPLEWELLNTNNGSELFTIYKNLIHLRHSMEALKISPIEFLHIHNDQSTLAFLRRNNQHEIVIAANFSNQQQSMNLSFPSSGSWYDFFNQEDLIIDNPLNEFVEIEAHSARIFLSEAIEWLSIENEQLPLKVNFIETFPNPFNNTISIEYFLHQPDLVNLSVFDLTGKNCRNLLNKYVDSGKHLTHWDGRDNNNNELSSGMYIIKLKTDIQSISEKIILLK